MPKSPTLKATVTRRPTIDPVDQAERLLQADHHEAVEVPTATPEPAPVRKAKPDSHALQSAFLARNLGKPLTVFTINGVKLTGKLRQFDQFTLLIEGQDGISSLVFKHAITTVTPASDAPGKQRQPQ